MRRPLVTAALIGTLACSLASGCKDESTAEAVTTKAPPSPSPPEVEPEGPPRLVVVLVIDQMRFDYVERFAPQWQHGLARLHDEGRQFTAAHHVHALTETAPGHATIATGTHPAHHGIVSNTSWNDEAEAKASAVDDPTVEVLGNPEAVGVSPAALLRETVGDWLQAAQPESIVISMALKDRVAILMGGKHPDAAIWYDDTLGAYTSSSYYGERLPSWVRSYNARDRAAAFYGEQGWTPSRPDADYGDSRRETDPAVISTFNGFALTKSFPHVIAVEGKQPRNVVRDTPFGDHMTLELARAAIISEGMGQDEIPDLLMLGMSGGDYAGHRYGPYSVEVHDYYLRLDEALGPFIAELDKRIGKDQYVLLMTADHGVAPMPEYSDVPTAGRYVKNVEVPPLMAALDSPVKPTARFSHGVELRFDPDVDEAAQAAYRAELAAALRADPKLADAWTRDELAGSEERNAFAALYRRSFHPERSADILLQFAPGVQAYPEGTGHGTPYEYDRHVPLMIRGPGLGGVHEQPVETVDIAPTVATLLGIEAPADLDGQPLPLF